MDAGAVGGEDERRDEQLSLGRKIEKKKLNK